MHNEAPKNVDDIVLPALLRWSRMTYGMAMRRALAEAGYDDIPKNGLYILGGLAMGAAGVPMGQLVHELHVTKQAAGQLVDTLVLRGYLERVPDADDRRKLTIVLTERGKAAAAAQAAARAQIDAALTERIGAEEVSRLRKALGALIDIGREAREKAMAEGRCGKGPWRRHGEAGE